MKKTYTINISGNVFHIEEDAFEQLQDYLESLSHYFSGQAGGQEIISDIESRIAELFSAKINETQEAVTLECVEEIMAKMGKPEDFMSPEEREGETKKVEKIRKRLYRDTENRVLGGVCSGLSVYLNIDPVILRILFILLVFVGVGISVVVYLILWIVVPKAVTTTQRLEMKGEEPTINNIQKTIQEEVKEVKDSFSRFNKSETYRKGKDAMNKAGRATSGLFRGIGRMFAVLVGGFFIFIGFISLVVFFISLILGSSVFEGNTGYDHSSMDLSSFLGFFVSPGLATISILLIVLVVGIPLLAIFFVGTKMIFRYKTNNKAIGLGAFGIWLIALISGITILVGQANHFSHENTATTGKQINCQSCKTLYLELGTVQGNLETDDNAHINNLTISRLNGKQVLIGRPHLNLESTDGNEYIVNIKRTARGRNSLDVQKNLGQIKYEVTSKDSTLVLGSYFILEEPAKWRDQDVQVTVKVPKDKKVHLGANLDQLPFDFESLDNPLEKELIGQAFMVTPAGVALNN